MKAADRKHTGNKPASAAHNGTRGVREAANAPLTTPANPPTEDRYEYIALRGSAFFLLGPAPLPHWTFHY